MENKIAVFFKVKSVVKKSHIRYAELLHFSIFNQVKNPDIYKIKCFMIKASFCIDTIYSGICSLGRECLYYSL